MLGFALLYFKGMRLMMFQLSSFYCKFRVQALHSKGPKGPSDQVLACRILVVHEKGRNR